MNENMVSAESNEIEINLLSLIKELIRRWYIIGAAAVCCAVLMIAFTYVRADRRYTSVATAYLLSKTDRSTAITTAELTASATLAADFAQIVESSDTAKETVSRLGLDISAASLKNSVTASYSSGNRVVTIRVKDRNADRAQKIAETLLEVANEKATLISSTLYVEVVDKPSLPASITRPGLKSPFLKGFLLGLMVACVCIVIRWLIRKPIWDETDMEEYFKAPSLGSISVEKQ